MKTNRLILVAAMGLIAFSTFAQKEEWTNLFNGKNIKGWKKLNGTAEYKIEDNAITGFSKTGSPNTFLATPKEYTNFVLELEVKMDEGLNSGVQIRSHSLPNYQEGRVHGLQVECEDSPRGWAGGLYDEARNGWRYPLEYNPAAKTAFRKGQWNTYRILAWDHHIITWINDIPCANLIEDLVEPGFIALQVHGIGDNQSLEGKKIQWKNIRIRTASESDYQQLGNVNIPEVSYLKNKLTDRETKDGWHLLWDGSTTQGWRGAKIDHFPNQGWSITDGELKVEKSGGAESAHGGDIVTINKYKNFVLEVDFKLTKGANSGVKYFVNTDLNKGEGSAIGCEFQLLDDVNHPDAKLGVNGNRTLGSLYDLIRANAKEFQPSLPNEKYFNGIDKWNRARVVVTGKKVEHYLNGVKVVEYERDTQQWRALVAYSKYKTRPAFGEAESGNILLQDHGDEVVFKNIKIKEL